MTKVRTWVGLDVHAATVVACVVDAESGEMIVQRLSGEHERGGEVLRRAARPYARRVRGRPDWVRARAARLRRPGSTA